MDARTIRESSLILAQAGTHAKHSTILADKCWPLCMKGEPPAFLTVGHKECFTNCVLRRGDATNVVAQRLQALHQAEAKRHLAIGSST
ncbi:hypothetical protein QOT17_024713 [Balamuthia mandrillaris]